MIPPIARKTIGETKKTQVGEIDLTTVSQGPPANPANPPADSPNTMAQPVIPNPDADQQFKEDLLDYLDNARRTTTEMRRTDFLMVLLFTLLSLLFAACVWGAVMFWRRMTMQR